MPWYDYQCERCGFVFEVQRAMDASSPVRCKSCGSTKTSKIFSATGIQFKGSGFYVTDSRGKTSSTPATAVPGSSELPAANGNGSANGKGAAKPATEKPASKPAKPEATPAGKTS